MRFYKHFSRHDSVDVQQCTQLIRHIAIEVHQVDTSEHIRNCLCIQAHTAQSDAGLACELVHQVHWNMTQEPKPPLMG